MGPCNRDLSCRQRMIVPLVLLAAMLTAGGCSSTPKASPVVLADSVSLKTVAVLPYIDMYSIYGQNVSFNCPLCGRSEMIDVVSDEADVFLTETLYELLKERGGYELIPPGQAEGVESTLLLDPTAKTSDLDRLLTVGRKLKADGLVLGRVYRFREREGKAYSVQTPAAVTFDLLLIEVDSGRLLWEGHYSESQQPLSENLYKFGAFLKRKGKWLTARELATGGLEQVLSTFPAPR